MHTSLLRHTLRAAATVAVVSLAACSDNGTTAPNLDPSLKSGNTTATTAAGTATAAASSSTAEVKVEVPLVAPAGAPFASAKGKAKFSSKRGERELQIEAENIPAGTAVIFELNGAQIGTGVADALRAVRLYKNSTLGDAVPMSVAGQPVSVKTAAGAVIVAGKF